MIEWIDRGDGIRLACRYRAGRGPVIVFLPGYMSDMDGTKAQALDSHAERRGQAMLRFDYSGCGASEGDFHAGSIRRWTRDAAAVIGAKVPDAPLLLVGSSMGGWVMLHLAHLLADRVAGLVGVAAAPDFTRDIMLDAADHEQLATRGYIERPSDYGDGPYTYSRTFLEDGKAAELLDRPVAVTCAVRLLQGQQDAEVPCETALRLAATLKSEDVRTILVKDGDHRLSRAPDLALLCAVVEELS